VPKTKRWELRSEDEELVLYQDGKVVARGLDEIIKIVGRCPKCGKPAASAYVSTLGYVYAWHVTDDGKKHAWYLGPAQGPWLEVMQYLRRKVIVLSDEDRRILYKVYVKKVKASPEERARAREILNVIINARRVVVYAGA